MNELLDAISVHEYSPKEHCYSAERRIVSEFNGVIGNGESNGVSRRTVSKAMAWAVPVIIVSAAVPAYAASQVNITFFGGGCKLPGNSNPTYKGYAFKVAITNASSVQVEILITEMRLNGELLGASALVDLPPSATSGTLRANPFILPAGISIPAAALVTVGAASSSNGTLTIKYTINGGGVITRTESVPAAPPVNGSSCIAFNVPQKDVLRDTLETNVPAWQPNHLYALGDTVTVTGGTLSAVTLTVPGSPTALFGLSGTDEPVLPGLGGTIVDNQVTWQRPG